MERNICNIIGLATSTVAEMYNGNEKAIDQAVQHLGNRKDLYGEIGDDILRHFETCLIAIKSRMRIV